MVISYVNKSISITNYDFFAGFRQKLILSVYLIIKLNEKNDDL